MDIRQKFGNVIKDMRLNRGWSQSVLAARAHLHRTYVTDIERGERNLTLENISKLAVGFGLPISRLFPVSDFGPDSRGRVRSRRPEQCEILMAEENSKDVDLALKALREAYLANTVHVVRDGSAALDFIFCRGVYRDRLAKTPPSILLLNLHLRNVSGLEVLRQLKAEPATREIKVVVLAGSRWDAEVPEALRLGAAECVVKPVGFENFSQATSKLGFWWTLSPVASPSGHCPSGKADRHLVTERSVVSIRPAAPLLAG